jgi:hypothetical protein
MNDGDTSPKIKAVSDLSQCVSCYRTIRFDELYGAHGMCSQCIADGFDEHQGA